MEDIKEVNQFRESAIRHYKYTQEGNWKDGNKEIKKLILYTKRLRKKEKRLKRNY